MAVTPSGILSGPMDKLADLWAASATFQSANGASSAADAKSRFTWPGWNAETQKLGPYVAIGMPETGSWRPKVRGSFGTGSIQCIYVSRIAPQDLPNVEDSTYRFLNELGAIIDEIMTESVDGDGRLFLANVMLVGRPAVSAGYEGDDKHFFIATIQFDYGPRFS